MDSQPVEGIQLLAPGVEVTPDDQARADAYGAPEAKPAKKSESK